MYILCVCVCVGGGGGESKPGNSCWGCAAEILKSWPCFRPKHVIFYTSLQTCPLRNYVIISYIRKNANKKISLKNPFRISVLLFLSYSFRIETPAKTFTVHFLKNHTRFQSKPAKNPHSLGRHIPVRLISESTPPDINTENQVIISVPRYCAKHIAYLKTGNPTMENNLNPE